MRNYLDTEFIEGFIPQRIFGIKIPTWLSKPKHSIQLISIGIVAEDDREFYLISNEFDPRDADPWVLENVIKPLYKEEVKKDFDKNKFRLHGYIGLPDKYTHSNLKYLLKHNGHTNKEIAKQIEKFTNSYPWPSEYKKPDISFYAYYADYDWVVFCSLFGRMIDLPKGFPMYCNDLKQSLDEKVNTLDWYHGRDIWSNKNRTIISIGTGDKQIDDRKATLEEKLKTTKELKEFPTQKNEHNALNDAKWNKKLHRFILEL
jgi:hypothetical protein